MAEGIRIKHVTDAANAIIAVRDITEPFTPVPGWVDVPGIGPVHYDETWPACAQCNIPASKADAPIAHQGYKTRHIRLGPDGTTIVSEGVWAGLSKFIDNGGFEIVNTVPNPPAVTLSFREGRDPHITVHHKVPREIRSKHGDGGT